MGELYIKQEQLTYVSFTCVHQLKIAGSLDLQYIVRPLGLHYNQFVSLVR